MAIITFAVPSVNQILNFKTVRIFSFCPLSESLERTRKVRLEIESTLLAPHASQDGVVVIVSFFSLLLLFCIVFIFLLFCVCFCCRCCCY